MAATAKRIKKLRKQHNLSQTELAKLVGVKSNTVSTWERGTRKPDFNVLCKLSNSFGVSIEYILGESADSVGKNENDYSSASVLADDVYYMVKKYCRLTDKSQKIIENMVNSIYQMELQNSELKIVDPLTIEITPKKLN